MTSNCTAVRVRPLGVDDNGDPIEGEPDELTIAGCTVFGGPTADIAARGRDGMTIDATVLTPFDADVLHTDLIRITDAANLDGLYTVDGNAESYRSPFTQWEAGDVIGLKRAAG